jgi:hypothetical protein
MKWLTLKRLAIPVVIVIISSCSLAFIGSLIGGMETRGSFEPWHPLGVPPEQAIEIYAHTDNTPFVKTVNGNFYHCTYFRQSDSQNCWTKVDRSDLEIVDSYPCIPDVHFNVPSPPGEVVDMFEFEGCAGGLSVVTTQNNFALLEDGSVWAWSYGYSNFSGISTMGYILEGFYWGMILGGIIVFVLLVFKIVRYKFFQSTL